MGNKVFTLIKNDGDGKIIENIISIELKDWKGYGTCEHNRVIVDEDLWLIECAKCGERLDPIQYLVDLARGERRNKYQLDVLKKRCEKVMGILENKTRTKCEHCGKLTNIKGLR